MCEKHLITCVVCNKEFKPVKGKANKYCNMECYRVAQRRGDYTGIKGGTKHKYNCKICDKPVEGRMKAKRRNGETVDHIFCSRKCYLVHHKQKQGSCAYCGGKTIRDTYKYCSHECRVEDKKPKPKNCVNCGCLFSAVKPQKNRGKWYVRVNTAQTCSDNCLNEFYRTDKARKEKISKAFRKEKHPNWQGGSHYGSTRGAGWNRIAEKCRELHSRTCKHCGMTETESLEKGWGRLQVNHIIPFHQWQRKEQANKQSNLEALCKSCHTKADWKWRKENHVQMSLDIFR